MSNRSVKTFPLIRAMNEKPKVDKKRRSQDRGLVMRKRRAKSAKKKIDWPEETEGDRLAREIRQRCNKLTSEQRREHFEQAMAMIYGGDRTAKAPRA
jgi:hypothetical protein